MIKQFIYMIILICVPAVTGWAAPTASEAGKTDVPVASGEQSVFDAGELVQGEEIIHTFTLSNRGKNPLVIERIQSDCSCTAADYDKTILPGTTGKVTLKVDTRGYRGQISRTSVLHVSDPENPRRELTINAHILPVIEITPNRVFLNGFTDEALKQEVLIQAHKKTPLKFEVEKSGSLSGIAYTLTPLEKDRVFRLTVTSTAPKAGAWRGRLIFRSNYPEKPVFVVPVFGRIMDEVQMFPRSLDFASAKSEKTQDLWLRLNRGEHLRITGMDIPEALLRADVTEVKKERLYRISLSPQPCETEEKPAEVRLTLHTDNARYPIFSVPVKLRTEEQGNLAK